MNIYYAFYCRAYDWYNTTGKKSKDTLRGSAICLISGLSIFNLLSIIAVLSVINRHTPINKWGGLSIAIAIMVFDFILISSKKSDLLREEYLSFDEQKKRKANFYFYLYLIASILIFVFALGYVAWYKKTY